MDPLYASSVLSSAERQVTDGRWPATDTDREMVSWAGPQETRRAPGLSAAYQATLAAVGRLRSRIARPATAPTR